MRIAVDARFLQADDKPELKDFTNEVFRRLSAEHKEHEFIFFTDTEVNGSVDLPKNSRTVAITPRPTNVFLYEWWYNVKLPLALRKNRADVFIATYGLASVTTSIKQVLIVRDLAFLHKQHYSPRNGSGFYKRHISRLLKKASAVVTLSEFVKEELAMNYHLNKETIQTIGSGADASFKPIDWEERETIKEQFAEGCEYFVFAITDHSRGRLLNVLKAFSIFKKWQKTNTKLVVCGIFDAGLEKDFEKLETYKYRNEVFIKTKLSKSDLSKVVAASYAMISPSYYAGFPSPVLSAMKCEVPVICPANSSMSEVAGEAALYADPTRPEELAEQMKKIFKDEQLRSRLIEAARSRSTLFTWDITADLLWKVVEQVLSK